MSAAVWEQTARVTSKLALAAEAREQALAVLLQEARDTIAGLAEQQAMPDPWYLETLLHVDEVLRAYRLRP